MIYSFNIEQIMLIYQDLRQVPINQKPIVEKYIVRSILYIKQEIEDNTNEIKSIDAEIESLNATLKDWANLMNPLSDEIKKARHQMETANLRTMRQALIDVKNGCNSYKEFLNNKLAFLQDQLLVVKSEYV